MAEKQPRTATQRIVRTVLFLEGMGNPSGLTQDAIDKIVGSDITEDGKARKGITPKQEKGLP